MDPEVQHYVYLPVYVDFLTTQQQLLSDEPGGKVHDYFTPPRIKVAFEGSKVLDSHELPQRQRRILNL